MDKKFKEFQKSIEKKYEEYLEFRTRYIEDRYMRGAKIVKKDRHFLAGVLKCSERDVLRFLKRNHLYSRCFYPGERTLGGIARGVGIEMGIERKPYRRRAA